MTELPPAVGMGRIFKRGPASGLGGKGRQGRAGATETSVDDAALSRRRGFSQMVPCEELIIPDVF
jgi:hypothetical protein